MSLIIFFIILAIVAAIAIIVCAGVKIKAEFKEVQTISVICNKCGGEFDLNPDAALAKNTVTHSYITTCPHCAKVTTVNYKE